MPINELAQSAKEALQNTKDTLQNVDPKAIRMMGDLSFAAGFASIAASIAIWGINKANDDRAHAERFGIFVGLWAPTFFILSNRLERYAERVEQGKVP